MQHKTNKRLTVKDIAAMAHVSTGTVDRVLHERGEVSEKTRKKILKLVEENGYERDVMASALASKKTYRIAVLIPSATKEILFWKLPQAGLQKAMNEVKPFSFDIRQFNFDYFNKNDFQRNAEKAAAMKPDGILMTPVFHKESIQFLESCKKKNIPVVLIDSHIAGSDVLAYVGQDSFHSGSVAAGLIHYGIAEEASYIIVNISKRKDTYNQMFERAKGFRSYFEKNKIKNVSLHEVEIGEYDDASIARSLDGLIKKVKHINGIFVSNSRVYKIADYLKKRKTKDIRLIGYDLLDENVAYLKNGIIHFLISQKPEIQAFEGIMTLFNHLVLKKQVEQMHHLPIDIITKENIDYYKI